jgi:hypothetical protein
MAYGGERDENVRLKHKKTSFYLKIIYIYIYIYRCWFLHESCKDFF